MDRRHKLIRGIHVSTASEHDTLHLKKVLDASNTSRTVWADKGYVDGGGEQRLNEEGWRLQIQRKGQSDRPLSECQKGRNRRIAKTRARVEHMFASLEQMGGKALRSVAGAGNAASELEGCDVQPASAVLAHCHGRAIGMKRAREAPRIGRNRPDR